VIRRSRRKGIVRYRLSIQAYALLVVYVAGLVTLYKIGVWAVRTYYP
jgi:hypothetical protein